MLLQEEQHVSDCLSSCQKHTHTVNAESNTTGRRHTDPRNPLFRRVYGLYSHRLLPAIGGMISKDRKAYEYLPASVDEFPAPECFMAMMREAGFKDCRARSQSLGIAQIYTGEK